MKTVCKLFTVLILTAGVLAAAALILRRMKAQTVRYITLYSDTDLR
ncbi:MAG: hypothetical protein U0L91_07175 [Gemmiger sp.]|nr:hypothetical protein [Gemmiger sp.]MEE0801045.1 hypothetical protein [Gemmiger sp.]